MEYPVDEQDAREKIEKGRLIQGLKDNQGYKKLLQPFLFDIFKKADKKCHDIKLREDRGKYAIAEYCVIESIMKFLNEHIENMGYSVEYFKDNNIKF